MPAAGAAAGRRNRTGAYLIMLGVGTAIFGMFFFLTLFMQTVWGYSALKTGVAYLPLTAAVLVFSRAASQLVPWIGARPLLLAGLAVSTGGPAEAGVAGGGADRGGARDREVARWFRVSRMSANRWRRWLLVAARLWHRGVRPARSASCSAPDGGGWRRCWTLARLGEVIRLTAAPSVEIELVALDVLRHEARLVVVIGRQ
jgi:hypothetical protein